MTTTDLTPLDAARTLAALADSPLLTPAARAEAAALLPAFDRRLSYVEAYDCAWDEITAHAEHAERGAA